LLILICVAPFAEKYAIRARPGFEVSAAFLTLTTPRSPRPTGSKWAKRAIKELLRVEAAGAN
jgi:hypothetical protein